MRVAIWLGAILCAAGALGLWRARPDEKSIILGDACRTPARVLGASAGPSAIAFHGFAASAAIMEPLGQSLAGSGWRVYLLDLAGHGRSSTHFSYARVETCARSAVKYLQRSGLVVPSQTVLIGHSLGAAVAIRLDRAFPAAGTVAISPALLAVRKPAPANLLVLFGQFDFRPVKLTARQLFADAGKTRETPADFALGRAAKMAMLSGELHGTIVLDPRAWRRAALWANESIGRERLDGGRDRFNETGIGRPVVALSANLALLAGLALLVAPALEQLDRMFRPRALSGSSAAPCERQSGFYAARPSLPGWPRLVGAWAAAAFIAVSVLGLTQLARFVKPVRLENGDWTALVALLTGAILLVVLGAAAKEKFHAGGKELAVALLASAALALLFGWAARWEVLDSSFSIARIWRWSVLASCTFPYFFAEEVALGPPGGENRFLLFFAMRALIWLAEAYAVLIFWPSGLLLVLLVFGLGIVSVGQRLAADALRRRGLGLPAVALFDAILAAGTLALILPLI